MLFGAITWTRLSEHQRVHSTDDLGDAVTPSMRLGGFSALNDSRRRRSALTRLGATDV